MGVVLPHGGLVADMFAGFDWHALDITLMGHESWIPAEFVGSRKKFGKLSRNGFRSYLGLINDSNDDNRHKWHICTDNVPLVGIPQHYLTLDTYEALRDAKEYKAGNAVIGGVEYRLHSAHLPMTSTNVEWQLVHLALLIRVDA